MVFLSSFDRLTWDRRGPAPFESAANVFLKIMQVNSLSFAELAELIRRPVDECGTATSYIDGAWVDFNRLSALLKVDQTILKQGYLDWLGFGKSWERSGGIRRCLECTQLRYHCSLFNLRIIDECPWHQCRLQKPCHECVHQLTSLGGMRRDWQFYKPCECGFDLSALYQGSRINVVPPELAEQIGVYCRRFVGWWATVKQQQRAPELVSAMSVAGDLPPNYQVKIALTAGLVLKAAPFPAPWKHTVVPVASKVIELRHARCGEEREATVPREAMREFSSVRRYVFRRYVRPHRKCLRAIRAMKYGEWHCLDGGAFCSVCVAYLTWVGPTGLAPARISTELHRQSANSHWVNPLKLIDGMTWGHYAEQALVRFLNVWTEIEMTINSQNLLVISSQSRKSDVDFPRAICEATSETSGNGSARRAFWLTGDAEVLAGLASKRCAKRAALRKTMVDKILYRSWCNFSWARERALVTYDGYTELFKVASPVADRMRGYTTIYA